MRRKKSPLQVLETEIHGLSHDGRGIARINNKVMFVFGGLPGEKVKVQTTRNHSRYSEGVVVEVLSKCENRVTPPCAHFGICGGCQMQHLSPASQILHKQQFLEEQLVHQAKVTPKEWLAPLTGQTQGYRQKARLGVRFVDKKDTLLVGFREQNNNKIAIIENCAVLDPRLGHHIQDLRQVLGTLEGRSHIAQIEVATGGEEIALVFRHLVPLSAKDIQVLQQFCQTHRFSLYLQPHGVDSVHKIWPENTAVELKYELKDQQLSYHFHPLDFTQVNQQINQQMVNQALDLLKPNAEDILLDLFCGLGNFTLPFAQFAQKVVGIEGSSTMVARAQANAQLNKLTNVEFHSFDLSKTFSQAPWALGAYTKLLLDPPRCGAQEIMPHIPQLNVKQILYISCNPTTFARDAAILVHQHKYHLAKVGIMDMFPHTAHVETMGLFLM